MRITELHTYNLKADLQEPFEWPDGKAYARTAGAIRIETDEGITGWAPANYGWTPRQETALRDALIGRSPLDCWRIACELAQRHVAIGVRGAVDIALWDIRGKATGEPIYRLLGGALRTRIPAYATGGYYALPTDSIVWLRDKVQAAVERGFRAYKMKVAARSLAEDLARVDAVLDVIGPGRSLAADATTTYTRAVALQMGRELERRGLLWFEDPLHPDDIDGYAYLTEQLQIPLTAHYAANDPYLLAALLRRRAVDQVQPSIEFGGGFTLAQQIIGQTSLQHVVYDPSCWSTHLHLAATLHLLAVIPSSSTRLLDIPPMLEFDTSENPLRDDTLLADAIEVEGDGAVPVPSGPGLGVTVDEDKLAYYQE